MYCKKCGSEVSYNDKFCKKCGESQMFEIETANKYRAEIKNHLALAIVSVLFCVPLGVPGLIFSTEVEKNIRKGNIEKAKEYSKKSKKYSLIGIVIGIPLSIVYITLMVISEIGKCN